ncbi:MAG: arginine--tRNA ligase [Candidatus Freyarchaeota archaeon]
MVDKLLGEIKERIAEAMRKAFESLGIMDEFSLEEIGSSLEQPPDTKLGDLSSSIAFRTAKSLRRKPVEIAQEIADQLDPSKLPLVDRIEVAPPGYINFYFNDSEFTKMVVDKVFAEGDSYGRADLGKGEKVLVEHTAVNPTKPLHIGHLRNAVLGDVVANLHRNCGWEVEVQNFIDDLGRQVGVLVWCFLNDIHLEVPREKDTKLDFWYGLIYAKGAQRLKENPELEKEVEEVMRLMGRGGNEVADFSRHLAEMCVESNLETTTRANIAYNLLVWESDIAKSKIWEETLKRLEESENFVWETEGEYKGCFVAKFSRLEEFKDKKNPDKVIIRSNGVPTYVAHDIAYQLWKFGKLTADMKYRPWNTQFNKQVLWTTAPTLSKASNKFAKAKKVINVIGYEQEYLQQAVQSSLKLLGYEEEAKNSVHLSYKHVKLANERFSGREGNWVGYHADAVINQTFIRAYMQVNENLPDIPELEKRELAEMIAVGAVRFWLIKFSTEQTIIFDFDKVTNFDGETGPYIQYAVVRAKSILEKADKKPSPNIKPEKLSDQREKNLIQHIAKYPQTVITATKQLKPHILAEYTYQLALRFSKFYEAQPVLTAEDEETKEARLALVYITKQTLENALSILGIQVPPRM